MIDALLGLPATHLLFETPFQNLKDGHHHDREGEEQPQAEGQLHCNSGPVMRQVQGDDVPRLLSKGGVPNLHQQQ